MKALYNEELAKREEAAWQAGEDSGILVERERIAAWLESHAPFQMPAILVPSPRQREWLAKRIREGVGPSE